MSHNYLIEIAAGWLAVMLFGLLNFAHAGPRWFWTNGGYLGGFAMLVLSVGFWYLVTK